MELKRKITLPTKLSEIPLDKFMEYTSLKDTLGDEDRALRAVAIFGDIPYKEVLRMPVGVLNKAITVIADTLSQTPEFQDRFVHEGTLYGFVPDLDDMSMGEFIDVDNYGKNPQDLWKVMSVLYRPITKKGLQKRYDIEPYTGQTYDQLKTMPSSIAIGAQVFFWALGIDLVSCTLRRLEEGMTQFLPQVESSVSAKNMDGLESSTYLLREILLNLIKLQISPFTRPYCGPVTKQILADLSAALSTNQQN